MRLKRFAVAALLVAAGFAGGTVFGYRVLGRPFRWLGTIGRGFTASQYAVMQYREAGYSDAREALEGYIRYLDSLEPVDDPCVPGEEPWLGSRGIRFDKTLAWTRLAMLHESNGYTAEAQEAWRQTDLLAAQGTWKDRSHQHFRDLITRLDQRHATPAAPTPARRGV
jgi:hypothetical protein